MTIATSAGTRSLAADLGSAHPFEDSDPPGQWLAMHIFYTSSNNPLLTECVIPLLRDLRQDGLLQRFFFIRYWMEGPHIRLRLRPHRPEDEEEIRRRAEEKVAAFLARRPALYEVDPEVLAPVYKELFLAEYSEEDWLAKYGTNGQIPLRENNTWAYIDYEPEYDRYGGPDGVRLAEWHFEQSSTTVLHLTETANVHVRAVLFGLAAQMMVAMAVAFSGSVAETARFFEDYGAFWEARNQDANRTRASAYEAAYTDMSESLTKRVGGIRAAVSEHDFSRLNGFMRHWAEHCLELRDHIARLTAQQRMIFPAYEEGTRTTAAPRPVTDLSLVLRILLTGYVHMTNNRLGVSIVDEIYLAYVLRRAFTDLAAQADLAGQEGKR
ncbi:MAG: thiopeptide-type bacteriocin biosynthesis protein [Nocardiopsaceae bacterium]|jgi:thiopeptide-type bacteriocin biosynthesis protein|nr:thiopeptide-type bacteriocin biosynthesis protein [Nocardiopsaceae bacterium]